MLHIEKKEIQVKFVGNERVKPYYVLGIKYGDEFTVKALQRRRDGTYRHYILKKNQGEFAIDKLVGEDFIIINEN